MSHQKSVENSSEADQAYQVIIPVSIVYRAMESIIWSVLWVI